MAVAQLRQVSKTHQGVPTLQGLTLSLRGYF